MPIDGRAGLSWPREVAFEPARHAPALVLAGSNIVLDLHGDPGRAGLTLFSDGNHHMALAESVAAFVRAAPEVGDVYYATLPPRLVIEAMRAGTLAIGNLTLPASPHVLISPKGLLERLAREGIVEVPQPFMQSQGTAILIHLGNPKGIVGIDDLLRPDVRLALSNPSTEAASFEVYEKAVLSTFLDRPLRAAEVSAYLRSQAVLKSRLVHHREIPELLASGRADVAVLYHHLALRYARIFPDLFEFHPLTETPRTEYAIARVGGGGRFGSRLVAFMRTDEIAGIYSRHGLSRASWG